MRISGMSRLTPWVASRRFEAWLESRYIPVRRVSSAGTSEYLIIAGPDGEERKIRFSNHSQPRDHARRPRGGAFQTEYGLEFHQPADYSVSPGEGTLAGARRFVRRIFAGQCPQPHCDPDFINREIERLRQQEAEALQHADFCLAEAQRYDAIARERTEAGDNAASRAFARAARQMRASARENCRWANMHARKIRALRRGGSA